MNIPPIYFGIKVFSLLGKMVLEFQQFVIILVFPVSNIYLFVLGTGDLPSLLSLIPRLHFRPVKNRLDH